MISQPELLEAITEKYNVKITGQTMEIEGICEDRQEEQI